MKFFKNSFIEIVKIQLAISIALERRTTQNGKLLKPKDIHIKNLNY